MSGFYSFFLTNATFKIENLAVRLMPFCSLQTAAVIIFFSVNETKRCLTTGVSRFFQTFFADFPQRGKPYSRGIHTALFHDSYVMASPFHMRWRCDYNVMVLRWLFYRTMIKTSSHYDGYVTAVPRQRHRTAVTKR